MDKDIVAKTLSALDEMIAVSESMIAIYVILVVTKHYYNNQECNVKTIFSEMPNYSQSAIRLHLGLLQGKYLKTVQSEIDRRAKCIKPLPRAIAFVEKLSYLCRKEKANDDPPTGGTEGPPRQMENDSTPEIDVRKLHNFFLSHSSE